MVNTPPTPTISIQNTDPAHQTKATGKKIEVEVLNQDGNAERTQTTTVKKGKVEAIRSDRTADVKTPQETLQIKLPAKASVQKGDEVHIEIKTTDTATYATLEVVKPAPNIKTEQASIRPAETPLNITLTQEIAAPTQTPEPEQKPTGNPDTTTINVRIEAITDTQVLEKILTPTQITQNALPPLPQETVSITAPAPLPEPLQNPVTVTSPQTNTAIQITPDIFASENIRISTSLPSISATILSPLGKNNEGIPPYTLPDSIPLPTVTAKPQGAAETLTPPLSFTPELPDNSDITSPLKAEYIHINKETQPFTISPTAQLAETDIRQPLFLGNNIATEKTAQIIATTPENLPVIKLNQTPSSQIASTQTPTFFILHTIEPTLIPGSEIIFTSATPVIPEVRPSTETTATIPPSQALASMVPLNIVTAQPWPEFTEIYQSLATQAPAIAQVISNIVPSASSPAQMTPALLFVVAALRAGDLGGFLGKTTTDAIKSAGKSDALSKLLSEFQSLSRIANEPRPQAPEWKSLALPFFAENEIKPIFIHYKNYANENNKDDSQEGGTRFVIDLSLNNMGDLQIDALVQTGRMDAILRTPRDFSQPMQKHMRKIYADALKETTVTGELAFQTAPESWFKVETKPAHLSNQV